MLTDRLNVAKRNKRGVVATLMKTKEILKLQQKFMTANKQNGPFLLLKLDQTATLPQVHYVLK